jgi:hypothetical protein
MVQVVQASKFGAFGDQEPVAVSTPGLTTTSSNSLISGPTFLAPMNRTPRPAMRLGCRHHPPRVSLDLPARHRMIHQRCCGPSVLYSGTRSGDGSPGYHPGHHLAGDLCDELIIAVVMDHRDAFPLRDSGDQQIRETNRPDVAAAPQRRLHVQQTVLDIR